MMEVIITLIVCVIVIVISFSSLFKKNDDKTEIKHPRNDNSNQENSSNSKHSTPSSRNISKNITLTNNSSPSPSNSITPSNNLSSPNTPHSTTQEEPTFTPNSSLFKANIPTDLYSYCYMYDYYPRSRFPNPNQIDLINRINLFNFKDGNMPREFALDLASAYYNIFGSSYLKNKAILIIPASTRTKTIARFKSFLHHFCEFTQSNNGFEMLTNSTFERNPQHNGGDSLSAKNLVFNGSFANKDFIVIDDVRTQGRSSNLVFYELMARNARKVEFCYIGRTVPL